MDPFSICLGVITSVGAARKVCHGLTALQHAPREIEELRNALDDVAIVLDRVAFATQTAETRSIQDDTSSLIKHAIHSARRVSEELRDYLQDLTSDSEASPFRKGFERVAWLRRRTLIKGYAVRLVNVKLSLLFALQAEQTLSYTRIEAKLDVVAETYHAYDPSKHVDSKLGTQVAATECSIDTSIVRTTPKSERRSSFNFRSADSLEKGLDILETPGEMVDFQQCDCKCHREKVWQSPSYLVSVFGRIHIIQRPSGFCYQSTCREYCVATSGTTSLSWTTPVYSPIQRVVSITIYSSPTNINLSFPRIVAGDAMIFHFATTGNVAGIKRLLEDGAASPDDVKCDSGFTPLHYAIFSNRLETLQFLIKARGNLNLHTSASKTALDYALAKVLTQAAEEETLILLAELVKLPDAIGDQMFSPLHKAILLRADSLTGILHRDIACLDKVDATGRTPISWAAEIGDAEAVGTLIDHLADFQLADTSGMTPLHYAATSKSVDCLLLLLQAGANPSAEERDRNWTPLHYAAFYQTDEVWVKHLLNFRSDVHARTTSGNLPLVLAIMKCYDESASALIRHGACIDARTYVGFTPLNSALISNSSACMQVLIDAGISLAETAWQGQTTLHLIARFADEEMVDCLMKMDLSCLDPNAIDDKGQTARMLLKSREAPASIVKAFARLCLKIADDVSGGWRTPSSLTRRSSLDNVQKFQDALEELEDARDCDA